MNFIINTLLIHAGTQGKQFEHKLVSIIDRGCDISDSNQTSYGGG